MDPPEGAQLRDGKWLYRIAEPWRREVLLARSEFVPDFELCIEGRCKRLTTWLPIAAGPATLRACAGSEAAQR
jgi:hypothetical protein